MGVYLLWRVLIKQSTSGEFGTGEDKSRKLVDRHVEYLANQREGSDDHLCLCCFGGCSLGVGLRCLECHLTLPALVRQDPKLF